MAKEYTWPKKPQEALGSHAGDTSLVSRDLGRGGSGTWKSKEQGISKRTSCWLAGLQVAVYNTVNVIWFLATKVLLKLIRIWDNGLGFFIDL